MQTSLNISNYKIGVIVSTPLQHGKLKIIKPFDSKKYWVFKVYKHKVPSRLINITGIRNITKEWPQIKKIIREKYKSSIESMKINNIFASQNLKKYKLSYNMKVIQEVGRKQYGQYFIFYYEPELSAALHVKSRTKPSISLMCYTTGSACIFLTHINQLYLVEKMLYQFYDRVNLKQACKQRLTKA